MKENTFSSRKKKKLELFLEKKVFLPFFFLKFPPLSISDINLFLILDCDNSMDYINNHNNHDYHINNKILATGSTNYRSSFINTKLTAYPAYSA